MCLNWIWRVFLAFHGDTIVILSRKLICKTKDEVLAKYATAGVSLPIGISEYELSKLLPEEYKGTLPTIEEIESELR